MQLVELISQQSPFIIFLELIISVGAVITVVASGVRWLVKHYFEEIKKELKPNSGSSLKDQVTRLEAQHQKLEQKIDNIYDKIIDLLSNNGK